MQINEERCAGLSMWLDNGPSVSTGNHKDDDVKPHKQQPERLLGGGTWCRSGDMASVMSRALLVIKVVYPLVGTVC